MLPTMLCIIVNTATSSCSEASKGLLSPMEFSGPFSGAPVHGVDGWDSGKIVDPFMHVYN